MGQQWQAVASGNEVWSALGLHNTPAPDNWLQLIHALPDADTWWAESFDFGSSDPGHMRLIVPRTRWSISITRARKAWVPILCAAYAALDHTHLEAAGVVGAIGVLAQLKELLQKLSPEEADMVDLIFGLSGGSPYSTPIGEDEVRLAYGPRAEEAHQALDSLESRGLLVRVRVGRIKLVI